MRKTVVLILVALSLLLATPTAAWATAGWVAQTSPTTNTFFGVDTASFTVTATVKPTLTSFSPASAAVGATVTLTGKNLTGASKVTFNGVSAKLTVKSATQITATVPNGLSSGKIAVTTPGGTATSAASFIATGWHTQTSGVPANTNLSGVAFANTADGWAVGYNGSTLASVILATTNGGASWKAQSSGTVADSFLYGVAFANSSDAWAVGVSTD